MLEAVDFGENGTTVYWVLSGLAFAALLFGPPLLVGRYARRHGLGFWHFFLYTLSVGGILGWRSARNEVREAGRLWAAQRGAE